MGNKSEMTITSVLLSPHGDYSDLAKTTGFGAQCISSPINVFLTLSPSLCFVIRGTKRKIMKSIENLRRNSASTLDRSEYFVYSMKIFITTVNLHQLHTRIDSLT